MFVPRTGETFSHDADGNLTGDGRWTYTWDGENRLVRMVANTAVGPQQRLDFGYDWQGRRVSKVVWPNTGGTGTPTANLVFVYDGWNLVAELNATNRAVIRSYVWGLDLSATQAGLSGSEQGAGGVGGLLAVKPLNGVAQFAAYDGNGNVVALVDGTTGTYTARYEYGPFGEPVRVSGTHGSGNPFRFSTKYTDDDTGLVYYGYRYYNPSTGRWPNRDPIDDGIDVDIPVEGGHGERGNVYRFVKSDAVNHVDPLGLYAVASEGFAFRDPWHLSVGRQVGSGSRSSSAAWYSGWGSPLRSAICNSGDLGKRDGERYPLESTSFVKAWLSPDGCASVSTFRVTCRASLMAFVWGRLGAGVPQHQTRGHILGDTISNETLTLPLSGDAFVSWFSKTVTKDITLSDQSYILYYLYMPVALQVKPRFSGGFLEHGEASCDISPIE